MGKGVPGGDEPLFYTVTGTPCSHHFLPSQHPKQTGAHTYQKPALDGLIMDDEGTIGGN